MTALRQVSCARCGRTADEGDPRWDEARDTASCPFCGASTLVWPVDPEAPSSSPTRFRTIGRRSLALTIDGVVTAPVGIVRWVAFATGASTAVQMLAYVAETFVPVAYTILCHGFFGRTVGKWACGVIVVDASGKPLAMRQAVLRDVVTLVMLSLGLMHALPDILHGVDPHQAVWPELDARSILAEGASTLWYLVDAVTALTNRQRRAAHDFIAGSVVVRT